jgi:hypothetical protein
VDFLRVETQRAAQARARDLIAARPFVNPALRHTQISCLTVQRLPWVIGRMSGPSGRASTLLEIMWGIRSFVGGLPWSISFRLLLAF